MEHKYIFKCFYAPGDLLMLSIAIRDLALAYPHLKIDTLTPYPEVFYNNPYITKMDKNDLSIPVIDLDYGPYLHLLRRQGKHFSDVFIHMFNELLDLQIEKTSIYPDIHLTDAEKDRDRILNRYHIPSKYWIINAGIKLDIPLKQYIPSRYQQVVDILVDSSNLIVDFPFSIVQTGSSHHIHPNLKNVINLVGKTDDQLRDLFALVYHCEGVIGPVSLTMHLAAAFGKPAVILAGGREESSWEKYPNQSYLHTIGKLDCCVDEGCWKANIADCPMIDEYNRFPKCMEMITVDQVISEILLYQNFSFV